MFKRNKASAHCLLIAVLMLMCQPGLITVTAWEHPSFVSEGHISPVASRRKEATPRSTPRAQQPDEDEELSDDVPADFSVSQASFVEPKGVYRYGFSLPDQEPGVQFAPTVYLDDYDPRVMPKGLSSQVTLNLSAAPGEYEPGAFLLFATRDVKNLQITPGGLVGDAGTLPAIDVEVRRVVRSPMRRLIQSPPTQTEVVGRFLPRWQPLDIPAGEFREIWVTIHVPSGTRPGAYRGTVSVQFSGRIVELPLSLQVHPFVLIEPQQKRLGIAYTVPDSLEKDSLVRVRQELRDIRAHEVTELVLRNVSISYSRGRGGDFEPNFNRVRRVLTILREEKWSGTIVVNTGLITLARDLGHQDVEQNAPTKSAGLKLAGDTTFQRVVRASMEGFLAIQREFPEFRLALRHMDEVFNKDRLPLFLRLTPFVRQVSIPHFVTFNTKDAKSDKLRAEIDPLVDIRAHHGYTFEWWLARGHTIAEYQQELARSGDEAWFYHNVRGVHFTPEWSRIINGIYLWAGPFRVHSPWLYQNYSENPFDDTDGRRNDAGMAFPGVGNPADIVSTRIWEAMREGYDDLRYIATLETFMEQRKTDRPKEAAAAQALLARIRRLVTDSPVRLPEQKGERKGGSQEAPLINSLAERFRSEDWQQLRAEVVEMIQRLQ